MENLKKSIIKHIENCEDEALLQDIHIQLLGPPPSFEKYNLAKEPDAEYVSAKSSQVPDAYFDMLDEKERKYRNGETTSISWEELKAKLLKKNGV